MPQINEGDVPIAINGHSLVLRPTLRALTAISNLNGGLAKTRDALVNQDFATVVGVIRHGANMTDAEAKRLPDAVFANGLNADILVPLIRYVGVLANGGKPIEDDPGAGEPSTEGNDL